LIDFTRLTIVGATSRAELVVPNDETVGGLIPRLVDLLGERGGSVVRPLTLVRSTGEQLDAALTVAEQHVADGELLRLLRQDEAPPPPEVADVTDVLGDSLGDRGGLWSATARAVTATVAIGALAVVCGSALGTGDLPAGPAIGLSALGILTLLAGVLGRARLRWAAISAVAAAMGLAFPVAATLLREVDVAGAPLVASLALGVILFWAVAALGIGVGLGSTPALTGGVLGAVLAGIPFTLLLLGMSALEAVSIGAVTATVACGLIPWYAMSVSGLTGLDDQVVEGRLRRRDSVLRTVNGAYRTLTWSTFAVAAPVAGASAYLICSQNVWAASLGGIVLLIVALRTRAFPLSAQVIALWGAILVGAVVGLIGAPLVEPGLTLVILAAATLVIAVGAGVNPAAHQRASLRRLGNTLEAFAMVALIPVVLGVFDVYSDLLGAF
jgi:hypothetical protein